MFCSVSPTYLLAMSLAWRISSGRCSAAAMCSASAVLPVPGAPWKHRLPWPRRLQRFDDARQLEARFDVQQPQVVGGDHRPRATLAGAAQRLVGIAELTLDQRLETFAVTLGVMRHGPVARKRTAVRICAGVRRAPLGQPWRRSPRPPARRLSARATSASRAPGGGRLQQQVVLKAAPEGWVDLLDAVGDPNHGHRVGLEDLVDPGFAADAAVHAKALASALSMPRDQLRGFGADRREHVLHLVEEQRHLACCLSGTPG